jgi:hypothetical protein
LYQRSICRTHRLLDNTLGATLTYITRQMVFRNDFGQMNLLESIDFDVLVLLASIMAINHIVVHLKETKAVISYLQELIRRQPRRGFWCVSFAAFIVSPFLTNDGVCLLFVEPILNAFGDLPHDDDCDDEGGVGSNGPAGGQILSAPEPFPASADPEAAEPELSLDTVENKPAAGSSETSDQTTLKRSDAVYFLLSLACSRCVGCLHSCC